MNRKNRITIIPQNPLSRALVLAAAVSSFGACDVAQEANTPRQFVDNSIDEADALELLDAADLLDALDVADFYLHRRPATHNPASGPFDLLPSECANTFESIQALGISDCYCMRDGSTVCIDFSYWDDKPLNAEPPHSYAW